MDDNSQHIAAKSVRKGRDAIVDLDRETMAACIGAVSWSWRETAPEIVLAAAHLGLLYHEFTRKDMRREFIASTHDIHLHVRILINEGDWGRNNEYYMGVLGVKEEHEATR